MKKSLWLLLILLLPLFANQAIACCINCNPDTCCVVVCPGNDDCWCDDGDALCGCTPEFTPVTAAAVMAGVGAIAIVMRKRLHSR